MEDLYSNLENYDDVNAVDELKNENRELKIKLEECSKTMNQLQTLILQDFDKLNSEYKKLEINYSSLLKTARAEIERKTQLITNLNKEKDMIVIRAMQGGCKNILKNLNKPVNNLNNKNDVKSKNEENREILDKNRAGHSGNSREGSRESPLLLMKDNSTAPFTNRSTSSEQNARQLDDGYRRENKGAQNQKHNNDQSKSMKISDRRKSMPVFSNGEELTSEDDVIKDDYTTTRDHYKYQDYDNASHNSKFVGSKGGQRTSRFEQYNREPKQYMYNRGKDRYNPNFDKYKSHNQNYDNYSPERGRQWHQRGNDYSHRSEHYRRRELESPPRNKYERSKSRDRRYKDSRWDRYEDNFHDAGTIREPDHKRRRMDSDNSEWERHDQAADRISHRPSEYRPDITSVDHGSCQSPDYNQIESNLNHHSIKEIKNTASVQLEDPRINSNKYSLRESERGVYIATVEKNVDMIPVDKTLWGFEKVEFPEALKANVWEEPANDDIVNYIYMDIDDPANSSTTKCDKDDNITSKTLHNFVGQDVCRAENTSNLTEQMPPKTIVPAMKSVPDDFKIPKKSNTDKQTSVQEKLVENDYNHRNNNDTFGKVKHFFRNEAIGDKNKLKVQKLSPVEHNVEGDLELSDETSDVTDELQITCKQNNKLTLVSDNENDLNVDGRRENDNIQESDEPRILDIMNITKDNSNVIRKNITQDITTEKGNTAVIKANIENNDKLKLHVENEKPCKEEVSTKKLDSCKKKTSKKKQDGKSPKNYDVKSNEKTNENREMESKEKKKREKRKRLSSKEVDQEKKESKVTHTNIENNEEKPKSSKPRSKFTELFGDSSSLITPEDLNLPTKIDINIERNDNYGSLFENTQDAIDINVRNIKETSKTSNSNKEAIENIETLAIDGDAQNTATKKSLFEINTDHPVANMFENLKPANMDDESNIVKTVVISSGIQPRIAENHTKQRNITEGDSNNLKTVIIPNEKQSCDKENDTNEKKVKEVETNVIKTVVTTPTDVQPCIEENNTIQTQLTEVKRNRLKETEEVIKKAPLAVPKLDSLQLKAVATSTPNKMHYDLPIATSSVPNSETLDSDSNISYSANLTTTNVESNSDAPDVRIFIKRRRKIKKT